MNNITKHKKKQKKTQKAVQNSKTAVQIGIFSLSASFKMSHVKLRAECQQVSKMKRQAQQAQQAQRKERLYNI